VDEDLKNFRWPQWQALKLKQINDFRQNNKEIFGKYQKDIINYNHRAIKKQFKEGARKVNKEAIRAGVLDEDSASLGGSFFGINDRKVRTMINSIDKDLKDVRMATLRMSNDVYRSTIYKASQMANSGAKTLNQAIDMATKGFLSRGFNCIEYKDGRRVNIADYADMAVRTATKRANLMGEGELRKKIGNPLVYASKHGTSCDKCSKWQGRVYIDDVWSGGKAKDGKYPLLSTAITGGFLHNRCRHGLSTYFEGINEEPEEAQENEHNKDDEYIQELRRRQKQYERLAAGSLTPENVEKYQGKVVELQNQIESDTIEPISAETLINKLGIDIEQYNPIQNTIQEQASKILRKDQLPRIVSKAEFEKYEGTEVIRYLKDYKGTTAEEAYKNTILGKIRYSDRENSQYGRGIYFGEKSDADMLNYTFGNGQDKAINAKISKDARILEFNSMISYYKDVGERTARLPQKLRKFYDSERSLIYMLEGYDGIKIKGKNYYCIFNRKVLVVNNGQ